MALIDITAKSRKFNYYTNLKDTEDTQVHKGKYDKYADLILQVVNGLILTINSLFFNLKVMVKLLNGACKKRILFFGIFINAPSCPDLQDLIPIIVVYTAGLQSLYAAIKGTDKIDYDLIELN